MRVIYGRVHPTASAICSSVALFLAIQVVRSILLYPRRGNSADVIICTLLCLTSRLVMVPMHTLTETGSRIMGKRSDFKRIARDCYDTPAAAVEPLLPHLLPRTKYVEPAAGAGCLIRHLWAKSHFCVAAYDIEPRHDDVARKNMLMLTKADLRGAEIAITNPPWGRHLLHTLILHMRHLQIPAWLLIDANWMFTGQAAGFLP